jgi:hypothetical protein
MPLEFRKSSGSADASKPDGEVATLAAPDVLRLHFARETLELTASRKPGQKDDDVTLTPAETRRLLGICIELIDLCSKVTGKIDPAIGTMVAYARDEAMADACEMT